MSPCFLLSFAHCRFSFAGKIHYNFLPPSESKLFPSFFILTLSRRLRAEFSSDARCSSARCAQKLVTSQHDWLMFVLSRENFCREKRSEILPDRIILIAWEGLASPIPSRFVILFLSFGNQKPEIFRKKRNAEAVFGEGGGRREEATTANEIFAFFSRWFNEKWLNPHDNENSFRKWCLRFLPPGTTYF